MLDDRSQNIRFQQLVIFVAITLFAIKLFAWYNTGSVAILTDALESIVNIISAFIGLYSLMLSAKPKDKNHPYGHGKIEFVSASIEGTMIVAAGVVMIYESIQSYRFPRIIEHLDYGIYLITFTAVINYLMGYWSEKRGKRLHSPALIASGKHLQSDTLTTIGIVIGLMFLYWTKITWLDSFIAFIFAIFIIYTGLTIIRGSLAGIMDEADDSLLKKVIALLQNNRNENWIDIHNLRIIKYGRILHFDCHLTVPWYFDVNEAHDEVKGLEDLIKNTFGADAEMFIHVDGCLPLSCRICQKQNCLQRKTELETPIIWTVDNVILNQKHQL